MSFTFEAVLELCLAKVEILLTKMAKSQELQSACSQSQEPLDAGESLFIQDAGDWRTPNLDFL